MSTPTSRQSGSVAVFEEYSRFKPLARLGQGGMGVVWEVFDREQNVRMAMKGLRTLRADDVLRFKTEFRALRDVRHPNLIRLGDLFQQSGEWFFTMELVEGTTFLAYVRGSDPAEGSDATAVVPARTAADTPRAPEAATVGDARDAPEAANDSAAMAAQAGGRYDEARLRQGLIQLTAGLAALHSAGKVHRDIKPSNILVDGHGRVVLLDFGVVAELAQLQRGEIADEIVGTAAYMAPEQGASGAVGPAADWYSVGTLLYHSLTGRVPFAGRSEEVLARKTRVAAPRPSQLVPSVPADLDQLCARLLDIDPSRRPGARELLSALGVDAREHLAAEVMRAAEPAPFVGRAAELAAIREAQRAAASGAAVAVIVDGVSGIGKSALVARAEQEMRDRDPTLLVLHGRCHERERVPYNAFDGVIDDLSRYLRRLDAAAVAALLPDEAEVGPLLQVFPALRVVGALADLDATPTLGVEPLVRQRRHAFGLLRRLLGRLGQRRPVVIVVEDLHWADADSLALLEELMAPADATGLLLMATARPHADGSACAAVAVAGADVRRLCLVGLRADEAHALVDKLLEGAAAPVAYDRQALIEEAAGHPLFIDELFRFAARTTTRAFALRLEDALWARVDALDEPTRALLELVACAGVPVAHSTLADAAQSSSELFVTRLSALRDTRLIRLTGTGRSDAVEPYHDRVRQAVRERLAAPRVRKVHHRLAEAMERAGAAPELIASQFAGAGEPGRAAPHALVAARNSAAALAFGRAAELYQLALTADWPADDRRPIYVELGDALKNAGRPGESAAAYLAARDCGSATADETRELLRCAAEQYLTGGYYDEGMTAARAVMAEVGVALPTTRSGAIAALVWNGLRLRLHRLRWRQRPASEIPARDLTRLDLYWSIGAGLSMVDTWRGALFTLRGALDCLAHGDDLRIARALCSAAIAASSQGHRREAARLMAAGRLAAESQGSELARFFPEMMESVHAFVMENDWRRSYEAAGRALERWNAAGRRGGWEADFAETWVLWSLMSMGRVDELRRLIPPRVRAAQQAGNRFMEVSLRTFFGQLRMYDDDADAGERDVVDAISGWLPGTDTFGNQHYWALKSRTLLALYRGDVESRASALEADWRRFDRTLFDRIEIMRIESRSLRGSLALARAAEARARGDATTVRQRLAEVKSLLPAIERLDSPFSLSTRCALGAGLAHLQGDEERAVRYLRELAPRAQGNESRALAAAARQRLAEIVGGAEGQALAGEAAAFFDGERIVRRDRVVAVSLPGWL